MAWLSTVARAIFLPFAPGGAVGPSYSLRAVPGRLPLSRTTLVTFYGVSTAWLSNPPSLSYSSGYGLVVGPVTVISDTSFTVSVTTGNQRDTVTWTEATYGISTTQDVRNAGINPGLFMSGRGR